MKTGSAAALAALLAQPTFAFPGEDKSDEEAGPFQNLPRARPNMLDWETLEDWITPQDQVFNVSHYGYPEVDLDKYKLEITGLVDKPMTLTLADLKKRERDEQLMTLECSGNGASPSFMAAIYNSKWGGTRLGALLKECGIKKEATEVVFFGADEKKEKIRDVEVEVPFGRSLDVESALDPLLLLAYERNGKPLAAKNGSPVRLIVPGCYGIANVKWLTRIELRSKRYMGRFMGRDYVTLRGKRNSEEIVYDESSVLRMNLKSMIARITRKATAGGSIPCKAYGAVWSDGTEIKTVEVKVDDGKWQPATLDKEPRSKYCWTFFSTDLGNLKPSKHTVVSRAIDVNGRIQPTAEDDEIALKKTYWEAYQQWPREIELKA
jgi:DMSO/TMAO reductase YedYZ molybdopterin-dependent catalytic subunit